MQRYRSETQPVSFPSRRLKKDDIRDAGEASSGLLRLRPSFRAFLDRHPDVMLTGHNGS